MKNIPVFVLCALLFVLTVLEASANKSVVNTIKFNTISNVTLDSLEADIQFVLSDGNEVKVRGERKMLSNLVLNPTNGTLKISAENSAFGMQTVKLQIAVPSTCLLDVSVVGNSHVFIPKMNSALRLATAGLSQVTVDACIGLVLTATGATKVQVNQINGDVSLTLSEHSEMGMKRGDLQKALITATEYSRVSIAASIQSINLNTKGAADIKLAAVSEAFMWTGRGNERVSIKNLSGVAEVAANYDSMLTVDDANLDTLLASASATGKITIKGSVKNAALSARGASQIVIDKVTGKILRNIKMHNGSIKIVNP
ncbi:MAG: DUF2807 domain-containing protein [Alphaproteobacteria bacterium]|nr:DUF2807 domain-containing protein [Alphaproteobacteria bacterium]